MRAVKFARHDFILPSTRITTHYRGVIRGAGVIIPRGTVAPMKDRDYTARRFSSTSSPEKRNEQQSEVALSVFQSVFRTENVIFLPISRPSTSSVRVRSSSQVDTQPAVVANETGIPGYVAKYSSNEIWPDAIHERTGHEKRGGGALTSQSSTPEETKTPSATHAICTTFLCARASSTRAS